MKKSFFLIILSYLTALNSFAQDTAKGVLSVGTGITLNDTYFVEIGGHYMLNGYVGVGGSVGYWKQFSSNGLLSKVDDTEDDNNLLMRPYLKPSVIAFTPPLLKTERMELSIGAEGSCMMNAKFNRTILFLGTPQGDIYKTYRSRAVSWGGNLWLQAKFQHVSLGLGYSLSTLELDKKISADGSRLDDKLTHGLFVRIAFLF
jgi:hypothetical protein